jgi:MFS family permease
MLQANSVALVSTSVRPQALRLALGIQAAAQALGLALGPALGGLLTAGAGWRAVYWVNVPAGCAALAASRYLLPRTRQFSPAGRFDWPAAAWLGLATTCLLLALSAAAGLALPGPAVAALAVTAGLAGCGFAYQERRAPAPLIAPALLRNPGLGLSLGGALCGYTVLFGPLVLVPQLLAAPGRETHVGLVLTALPVGFGLAALAGQAAGAGRVGERARSVAGALISTFSVGILSFVPLTTAAVASLLALTGLGLGAFVPANNAAIMRSAPATAAATLGGLVNLARGIGTTLGIALVTLALHLAGAAHPAGPGAAGSPRSGFLVLAAAGLAAAGTAASGRRPPRADGGGPGDPDRPGGGPAPAGEGASDAFG